jgi:hypothetical protein
LGKFSDKEIAARLNRTPEAVRGRRKLYGLHDPSTRASWNELHNKLLGTASDAELARRLGCNVMTIRRHRIKLGISPWRWKQYLSKPPES